jgi:hypothetical protein
MYVHRLLRDVPEITAESSEGIRRSYLHISRVAYLQWGTSRS